MATTASAHRANRIVVFEERGPIHACKLGASLIGVVVVKVLLHFFLGPFGGSLASLRGRRLGRRMMGSGERGVSICFTTLRILVRQVRDSQRDRLAHRPHGTIRASPFRAKALFVLFAPLICLGSRRQCGRLLSEAELGRVGPHAVQDDGQFAGHRHASPRHAAAPGDVHAPRFEA